MNELNTGTSAESTAIPSINVGGTDRFALLRRLQYFLHGNATIIPALVLALSAIVFSVLIGGHFFAAFNLSLVLQQITIIAIAGIAQTLVILTAGIDLSVGAILALSSVVMGARPWGPTRMAFLSTHFPYRSACRIGVRLDQRVAGHVAQASPFHRNAWHLEHLLCARPLVLTRGDHQRGRHTGVRRHSYSGPEIRSDYLGRR